MTQFISNESHPAEWHHMWQQLANHEANRLLPNPYTCFHQGEVWQYMGTSDDEHTFRHRHHPKKEGYFYIKIPFSQPAIK